MIPSIIAVFLQRTTAVAVINYTDFLYFFSVCPYTRDIRSMAQFCVVLRSN